MGRASGKDNMWNSMFRRVVETHPRQAADIGYEAIVVRKVKSHRSLSSAQGPDDLAAIAGNNIADKAAKDAASRLPTLAGAAEIVNKTAEASDVVARFLVHIHVQYHRRFGSLPRRQPAEAIKVRLVLTKADPTK